ncbi:uncharacterized protein C11orf96 homolog isoform X2 [Pipistrellus kuhlii]|uniref:uncharacterized protein C11orf96 homolog isoform X2 n=1 Tax=Pipistrellus kuhlii TaxID=59472 RepID=UPI001E26F7F3|nr:uncharacterized protein C11orf96 homolog isoform X2 [Pipistrellus kuhlii]
MASAVIRAGRVGRSRYISGGGRRGADARKRPAPRIAAAEQRRPPRRVSPTGPRPPSRAAPPRARQGRRRPAADLDPPPGEPQAAASRGAPAAQRPLPDSPAAAPPPPPGPEDAAGSEAAASGVRRGPACEPREGPRPGNPWGSPRIRDHRPPRARAGTPAKQNCPVRLGLRASRVRARRGRPEGGRFSARAHVYF